MPEEKFDHSHAEEPSSVDPFEASVEEVQPLQGGIPSPSVPGTGNRPAEGARHATPGEILGDHFQGSEAAGDFLGLDVEILADADPPDEGPAELELAAAPVTAAPPDEAEEFHFGEADEGGTEDLLEDPATAPGLDDEFGGEDGVEEEDLEEHELEAAEGSPSPVRRVALLAGAAFAVGLAAVAALVFAPGFLGKGGEETLPSGPATTTHTARGTDPAPPPAPSDPAGTTEVPAVEPADPLPGDGATVSDPGVEPATEALAGTVISDPTPVEPPSGEGAGLDPGGTEVPEAPIAVDLEALGLEIAENGGTVADGAEASGGTTALDSQLLRQLDDLPPDQLEMIWRGETTPLEALDAPVRILMPRVGNVRITMTSDAVFDGKLVSMGKGELQIDTNLGRMGLAGERVARIERLASAPTDAGEVVVTVARGDRVRVRTLGGVLTGRVLSQKDGMVVVQTDGGGRVTLHDPAIEPIGSSRAIVVEQ